MLKIFVPGFYFANPESDIPPATLKIGASLEYPIGIFKRVTFAGAIYGVVKSGHHMLVSDVIDITIQADAVFYIKLFVEWKDADLPLTSHVNCLIGEWVSAGRGLPDQTMTDEAQINSMASYVGFQAGVLGIAKARSFRALGLIGDSIAVGAGGGPDTTYGGYSFERGLRNRMPVLNLARGGDRLSYYKLRSAGRSILLQGSITHLLIQYGRNDISSGVSADTLRDQMKEVVDFFGASGVQIYATTLTPYSISNDGWASTNQIIANMPSERQRIAYNAMLRFQWSDLGLSGIFDFAHVVDPSDSGKWNTDGIPGDGSYGSATLVGSAVESVAVARGLLGRATGRGYPALASIPCLVHRYPDDPIRSNDAMINAETNSAGSVFRYTVLSGGAYTYPPMVAPQGAWTHEGMHPSVRGYNDLIVQTGFCASAFK